MNFFPSKLTFVDYNPALKISEYDNVNQGYNKNFYGKSEQKLISFQVKFIGEKFGIFIHVILESLHKKVDLHCSISNPCNYSRFIPYRIHFLCFYINNAFMECLSIH